MATTAVSLAALLVYLEATMALPWLSGVSALQSIDPGGARSLLSTVAGSMITVAGVTFSMTLLAVSHASSQIGPRLMTSYMEDRGNQVTLGTFIATFLYCLMVLSSLRDADSGAGSAPFVPYLAVLFGLVLAIISVMVLIYFIHHVPQSISVPRVISAVGDEMVDEIDRQFSSHNSCADQTDGPAQPQETGQVTIVSVNCGGGYLRLIDHQCLLTEAVDNQLVVKVLQRPGNFAISGDQLLSVASPKPMDKHLIPRLRGAFAFGPERTREQDIRYPLEQMQEILAKAMSPGVNGQFTALLCLDQLARAVTEISQRAAPEPWISDDQGVKRIKRQSISHEIFATAVFLPLRQFLNDDALTRQHWTAVLERLHENKNCDRWRGLLAEEIQFYKGSA